MVSAFASSITAAGWIQDPKRVKAGVTDSHDLGAFTEHTFSVSVCNFSVFTFADPSKCLAEMFRTLDVDGTAIVTTWKRFTVGEIIHAAQRAVKPGATPMHIPKAEFIEEGYLRDMVVRAGFEARRVEQHVVSAGV